MAQITLNRKGWIDTPAQSENQCKDIAWGRYSYEVAMTCDENNTDEQDFIIDNSVVHFAILDCFKSMSSCEAMVKRVGWCLWEKAEAHGIRVKKIKVTIRPRGVEEHSYAWFDWERDFEKQPAITRLGLGYIQRLLAAKQLFD